MSSHMRVPPDLVPKWLQVRDALNGNNEDVLRWLFEKCNHEVSVLLAVPLPSPIQLPTGEQESELREPEATPICQNNDEQSIRQRSPDVHDTQESLSDLDDDIDVMTAIIGSPRQTLGDDDSRDQNIECLNDFNETHFADNDYVPTNNEFFDMDSDNEEGGDGVEMDQGDSQDDPGNEELGTTNESGMARYAFVAKNKLLEFFEVFTVLCHLRDCDAPCTCCVKEWGMCFSVTLTCAQGHRTSWQTGESETHINSPAIAPRLYCATLCAGLSCTQLQEICRIIGLHQPSEKKFYTFQSGKDRPLGWCEAVLQTWEEQKTSLVQEFASTQRQQEALDELRIEQAKEVVDDAERALVEAQTQAEMWRVTAEYEGGAHRAEAEENAMETMEEVRKADEYVQTTLAAIEVATSEASKPHGIIVMVDTRFDSSRSGYHGTTPILEKESGMCIEMVTHTRVEDQGSWNIEDAVVKEGLQKLQASGVNVIEAIHDDKTSVDAILRSFDIVSQKDLWHKAKKLMQKFKDSMEQAKEKVTPFIDPETTEAELRKKTNKALQAFLKEKKERTSGNKAVLVERCMRVLGLQPNPEGDAGESSRAGGGTFMYPVFSQNDMAYKFKSWFYVCCTAAANRQDETLGLLCADLANVVEHWAGNHALCKVLDPQRKCVVERYGPTQAYFQLNSSEYVVLVKWLAKHITQKKMVHYLRAWENFLSETYHSVINKYASKRIHWRESHMARLACAALDWNENRSRECLAIRSRATTDTVVRRRPKKYRVLSTKTEKWKEVVTTKIFGAQPL